MSRMEMIKTTNLSMPTSRAAIRRLHPQSPEFPHGYLDRLAETERRGEAREESFYPHLIELFDGYAERRGVSDLRVMMLPRKTRDCLLDFQVRRGERIAGYVEAKRPGTDLDRSADTEQVERYRLAFPNLLLTNFRELRLYRGKEMAARVDIGRPGARAGAAPLPAGPVLRFRSAGQRLGRGAGAADGVSHPPPGGADRRAAESGHGGGLGPLRLLPRLLGAPPRRAHPRGVRRPLRPDPLLRPPRRPLAGAGGFRPADRGGEHPGHQRRAARRLPLHLARRSAPGHRLDRGRDRRSARRLLRARDAGALAPGAGGIRCSTSTRPSSATTTASCAGSAASTTRRPSWSPTSSAPSTGCSRRGWAGGTASRTRP